MAMTTDAPDSSAAMDTGQDSQESFKVCIECLPDGTYSVYAEDSDDDQDDGQSSGNDDQAQPAKTLDEALQMARQLIMQEGQEDQGDGNAPMDKTSALSYWNQLAAKKGQQ